MGWRNGFANNHPSLYIISSSESSKVGRVTPKRSGTEHCGFLFSTLAVAKAGTKANGSHMTTRRNAGSYINKSYFTHICVRYYSFVFSFRGELCIGFMLILKCMYK